MSARHSNPPKPDRPEGSPLFWHQTGRWAKKIRGRLHYFGRGSHDEALEQYQQQAADLHAGRRPGGEAEPEGLTVYGLTSKFLTTKIRLRDQGELSPHTFTGYGTTCKLLVKHLGRHRLVSDLRPDDFEAMRAKLAKKWGPVRLGNFINMIRIVFRYGLNNGLMTAPVIFGEGFKRPSAKTLRAHKAGKGPKMFEANEVRAMLEAARQPLRAMILMGLNCGFGNADVGRLPRRALDVEPGWVNFPRPKTAIARRIPLWPETTAAIKEWLDVRPAVKEFDDIGRVFLTHRGATWTDFALAHEMRKLLDSIGIDGRGFYCLRHTTQTVGDESGDFLAVRRIMGHTSSDIADVYRERVSDDRLRKVTEFIRSWVFQKGDGGPAVLPFGTAVG